MTLCHKEISLAEAVREVAVRLEAAGCETPRVDAQWLVAHVVGTTRSGLHTEGGRSLSGGQETRLAELLARREAREPLAYVLGEWGFRRLTLRVDARALVPRPETEVVVERCLVALADRPQPAVLDIGTGSGAIALAIADEHPGAEVIGIDVSEEALSLARENAALTALDVTFVRGDLRDGLPAGPWDLVVSNPPYVDPGAIERLGPEVREWEPRVALVGRGETEEIVTGALEVLRLGGRIVLEVADGTAGAVADALGTAGYDEVRVTEDLAGRERVVEGVRR